MQWTYYAMAAALALAAADVLVKAAAGRIPNSLGMLLYGSVPFLTGLTWWLLSPKAVSPTPLPLKGIAVGLGVGVMYSTVTFCMYAAFRLEAPISIASPLIRLGGLVVAGFAGVLFWKEPVTARYITGLLLVCLGMYLIMTK